MIEAKPLRLKVQKAQTHSVVETAEHLPVLRVMVDTDVFHLDEPYDYLLPARLTHVVHVGSLVRVPFGGRTCTGLVIDRISESQTSGLKHIEEALTSIPVLSRDSIALLRGAATRYACSLWDLMPDAVPTRVQSVEKLFQNSSDSSNSTHAQPSHSLQILSAGRSYSEQIVELATTAMKEGQVLIIVPDEKELNIVSTEVKSKLGVEPLIFNSQLSKSDRFRNHLKALYQKPEIVVGTRNSIFTHLDGGSTIIIFQDGDASLVSRRNPEWNVRDIALLRAKQVNLIFASFTPTLEVARLVELGWLTLHQSSTPAMQISCEESDPRFHPVISAGLKKGSVLVTVASAGYVNSFACQRCRNHALCSCGGRLVISATRQVECSLCEKKFSDWSCLHCDGKSPRAISRGSARIAQELGSAHPGTSVLVSSGKNRIDLLPEGKHLVISTNGAEPVGQYSAVILLGGDSLFNRVGLHAEETARRDWFTALSMLQPGGLGYISLPHSHPVSQSLIKWSLYPQITQEIVERGAAHLPPYFRLTTVEGSNSEITALRQICEELPLFKALSSLRVDAENSKLLLRSAVEDSEKVSQFFYDFKRVRSLKALPHLKIRLDPYEI